jgi:Na+-transporting methylmalonyl-CoA/oxaloacetate decarboxylase gamma subunit
MTHDAVNRRASNGPGLTVLRAGVTLVLAVLAILVLFPAVIAAQVAAAL